MKYITSTNHFSVKLRSLLFTIEFDLMTLTQNFNISYFDQKRSWPWPWLWVGPGVGPWAWNLPLTLFCVSVSDSSLTFETWELGLSLTENRTLTFTELFSFEHKTKQKYSNNMYFNNNCSPTLYSSAPVLPHCTKCRETQKKYM